MRVPILGGVIDERFLRHRLRSTSTAGMAGCVVAMGLFMYRNVTSHVWDWGLFAVGATMAIVKVALMTWYRVRD